MMDIKKNKDSLSKRLELCDMSSLKDAERVPGTHHDSDIKISWKTRKL